MSEPARDENAAETSFVRIGVLTKAHGVRGELVIHLDNPHGDVLREDLVVRVELPQTKRGAPPVVVERRVTRVFAGGAKLALEGVETRDAADLLRGAVVSVRREDFPEPDDDEVYLVDFVGARVVDTGGVVLGHIAAFAENGAQPLAIVRCVDGRDVEMPFVEGLVVSVDDAPGVDGVRRVVVAPPIGLFAGEAAVAERADDEDDAP